MVLLSGCTVPPKADKNYAYVNYIYGKIFTIGNFIVLQEVVLVVLNVSTASKASIHFHSSLRVFAQIKNPSLVVKLTLVL